MPPPEVLHDAMEAALGEDLHVVSDETWRDTVHSPRDTVLISPAEMRPHDVTVLTGLSGGYLPADWPAGAARFPATADGAVLRSRTLDVLTAMGAFVAAPVAAAAAHALGEPAGITERLTSAVRLHARVADAVHQAVLAAGAMSRPPQAGRHLYVDMGQLSTPLAARGVSDAMELEDHLTERLGMPAPGGHRFGDELDALRVRLSTGPFLGVTGEERLAALDATEPLQLPYVASALSMVATVLGDLRADRARGKPPR